MKTRTRKEDIEKFDNSKIGKTKNYYFKRTKITGILCMIIGICWIIINVYIKSGVIDYIISSTLIAFGLYFIIYSNILKNKEVNKYIYNNKKVKK